MSAVLGRILADKRDHVAACMKQRPLAELEALAKDAPSTRGFAARLAHQAGFGRLGLIAEIKRASPSKGLIRKDFDPAALARAYEAAGATCLSVLTDAPHFWGKDEYLSQARQACKLPALRKDFIINPYQVVEARALGADCILLIMAALEDGQAAELVAVADSWKLDVLVEVHDANEMERAAKLRTMLLGVNNRNLKTMDVDLGVTEALAHNRPSGRVLVSESGICSHDDLVRLRESAGVHCFLVGESLMRQDNVEAATRLLLGPDHIPFGSNSKLPRMERCVLAGPA